MGNIYIINITMKFGILKSKIDTVLVESYGKDSFKSNMSKFKQTILSNNKLKKLFYLYDDLTTNKGLSESVAKEYLQESVEFSKSIKLSKKDIQPLNVWLKNVVCENKYIDVDNVLFSDVLKLESKIESKNKIVETLKTKKNIVESNIKIPLSSMVIVANNSFKSYLDNLDESVKNEVLTIINSKDEELIPIFEETKSKTLDRLSKLNENLDESTSLKLQETIDRVKSDVFTKKNYVKLLSLYESL